MASFRRTLAGTALLFSLSGCLTGSLSSFVVYSNSAPKSTAALFRLPFANPDDLFVDRATGSPTSLRVSIFSFYLAASATCATPIPLVDYGNDPLIKDFYTRPPLFSGNPAPGAYECMILQVSDTMVFKPDAAAVSALPACGSSSGDFSFDGYVEGQSEAGTWKALSGQSVQATGALGGPRSDVVTLFASTDPAAAIAYRGLAASQMIPLSAPVQAPGEITIYSNYLDAVAQTSDVCTLSGGLALGLD